MRAFERDRLSATAIANEQNPQQRIIKKGEFANRAARRAIVKVTKQIKKKGGLA